MESQNEAQKKMKRREEREVLCDMNNNSIGSVIATSLQGLWVRFLLFTSSVCIK